MNSTKSHSEKEDLLDHLLQHYDNASAKDVEEMRSQVFTFLLAGHETSSVALAWTLYELAKNPEIQTKAREEVLAVLGKDLIIEWSKLDELKFLGNIVKESLRLHSPVYHVVRQAIEDDVIDGYLIPKGTTVAVGIQTTHILGKYWNDPDSFRPERFQEKGTFYLTCMLIEAPQPLFPLELILLPKVFKILLVGFSHFPHDAKTK